MKSIIYKFSIATVAALAMLMVFGFLTFDASAKTKPYLSVKGKRVSVITVYRNRYKSVRINGKVKTESHNKTKYAKIVSKKGANILNVKGLKVTAKNKPAVLKIKVNGTTLKLKVRVKAKTKYQKLVNVSYKLKKSKIKLIYKNTISLKSLYKVKTNLDYLVYWFDPKITQSEYNKYKKYVNSATYSVNNKKVLSLNKKKGVVKCKSTGKAKVTIAFKDGTRFTVKITVTKPKTKKIKVPFYEMADWGEYVVKHVDYKTAKVCYNYDDVYKAIKNEFYTYIIKGKRPKYEYLSCAFGKTSYGKLLNEMFKRAKKELNKGDNFYEYCWDDSNPLLCFGPAKDKDSTIIVGKNTSEDWKENENDFKKQLKENKLLYDTAQANFKEMNINEYTKDYQKITILGLWMDKHYTYANPRGYSIYSMLINKKGVCSDYAEVTTYYCTLLRIPCFNVLDDDHEWNVVNIQGKWYHLDILWRLLFLGDEEIRNYSDHKAHKTNTIIDDIIEKNSFPESKDLNRTLHALLASYSENNDEYYIYKIEYTADFYNKVFGWNGVEKIDLDTLEREYHYD